MLYFRMILMIAISLYTSRINLEVLGVVDKGILELVGGTVAMFGFLTNSLSGSTSRFLTLEIGRGDKKRLADVFATALNFHIVVVFLIFVISETVGLWFLECKAVIPADRMFAARIAYQICILSSIFTITQVPYTASLIAHERMGVFAYMSLLDAVLKLLVCYLLFISPFDKLISMSVLTFFVGVGMIMIYRFYCMRNFEECRFKLVKDMSIVKPMFVFSGWDFFGHFAGVVRTQGMSLLLNTFFGPVVNAAVSFSNVISSTLTGFSNNFLTAIKPPLVKAYALQDFRRMRELMCMTTKYAFALLFVLSNPFIFKADFILELWLKTPPEWTGLICRWEIVFSLIVIFFIPLLLTIHATGKIKRTSITNASIILTIFPISYILLLFGFNPTTPYIIKSVLQVFVGISYFYNLKRIMPEFECIKFVKNAISPCLFVVVLVELPTYWVNGLPFENEWISFFATCSVSTILCLVGTYFILFDQKDRQQFILKIKSKLICIRFR